MEPRTVVEQHRANSLGASESLSFSDGCPRLGWRNSHRGP